MKIIDFWGQALLILAAFLMLCLALFRVELLLWFFIIQLVLGTWQLGSSVYSVITHTSFHFAKRKHLLMTCGYFILVVAMSLVPATISEVVWITLLTIPAWALAIYYFTISYKCAFHFTSKKGSFLPNINF